MTKKQKLSRLAVVGSVIACTVLALAAASFASPPKSKKAPAMVRIVGGTLTVAEAAGAGPNYIFPMMGSSYFLPSNIQLIYLLYRPLYWFGSGSTPMLNDDLSLAVPPAFSNDGTRVTIKMKGYKWSNGETVNAADVVFWMNLLKADATSWGGYVPGTGQFPGNVTNVTADNKADTVTFSLDVPYGSYWFTYNELSQITPLPMAWDITAPDAAPGSGGCSSAPYLSVTTSVSSSGALVPASASAKRCAAVYAFLTGSQEAADPGTYASNPLWKTVDGPFSLSAFDATDFSATLVPNRSYSGPVKSSLAKLVLEPFSTDTSEYKALRSGSGIDIGYVEPQDLPAYTGPAFSSKGDPLAGGNSPLLASRYNLDPVYPWSINYFVLNYTNPTTGPIFRQLYIRQAMQSLMNQTRWIQAFNTGYGAPTYGPVPVYPPTDLVTKLESSNPYRYSVSRAKSLLRSHGWKVVPGGVTTCARPGTASNECGADIAKGAQLSFRYLYYLGSTSFDNQIVRLAGTWALAGIKLQLKGSSNFDSVVTTAAAPCTAGKACNWEMANWEGGWNFIPDYYPSGEETFATNAGSNFGGYSDPTADRLIRQTDTSSSLQALYSYENYLATHLPVIWQPDTTAVELNEVAKGVCGFVPENPLFTWAAEDWYLCRPAR